MKTVNQGSESNQKSGIKIAWKSKVIETMAVPLTSGQNNRRHSPGQFKEIEFQNIKVYFFTPNWSDTNALKLIYSTHTIYKITKKDEKRMKI